MINKIQEDIKTAMRTKDTIRLTVLRAIKTAITNAAIIKGNVSESLSNPEIIGIIRKQYSQRVDSIIEFKKADRQDLIDKESQELLIISEYLPVDLSDEKLGEIIDTVLADMENPTIKNMKYIMEKVTTIVDGCADNKKISELIRSKLA